MTTRRRMTKAQRLDLLHAHGGLCHICGGTINLAREAMEVEHVIPLAIGGKDDLTNMQPAHVTCHRAKTSREATMIAKVKRVAKKHAGKFRPPRRIVPGSKASPWKKRLDGTVEWRPGPSRP